MNSLVDNSPAVCAHSVECTGQRNWFAVYTRSRHEKIVAEHLRRKSVQHLLPLYRTVHRWKNGRAEVQLPLFPGYVFVCVAIEQLLQVLRTPGVVRMVGVAGRPAPIAQSEIAGIEAAVSSEAGLEPLEHLASGACVRIKSGPLEGLEGVLIRRPGSLRLVLSVTLISRSIAVEVSECDVGPSSQARLEGRARLSPARVPPLRLQTEANINSSLLRDTR